MGKRIDLDRGNGFSEYMNLLTEREDLTSGRFYATCQEDYDEQRARLTQIDARLVGLRREDEAARYRAQHNLTRGKYRH